MDFDEQDAELEFDPVTPPAFGSPSNASFVGNMSPTMKALQQSESRAPQTIPESTLPIPKLFERPSSKGGPEPPGFQFAPAKPAQPLRSRPTKVLESKSMPKEAEQTLDVHENRLEHSDSVETRYA